MRVFMNYLDIKIILKNKKEKENKEEKREMIFE